MFRPLFVIPCLVALPACERNVAASSNDAGIDAAPAISATAASEIRGKPPEPDPSDISLPAVEPLRRHVLKMEDDPALLRQRDAIDRFFNGNIPSPLSAQFEALPANRWAILVSKKAEMDRPFVFVVDANGTRAWTKEMPLAGIVPGVRDVAIVRGENSSVGVAFCDSTGKIAALRTWLNDGGINADFQVIDTSDCEFISAVYVPGVGHVVAASGNAAAQVGMIAANGMRAWGASGVTLPWSAAPHTATTIVVDSENSFIAIGVGSTDKENAPAQGMKILAMRYDFNGKELWLGPTRVGRLSGNTPERVKARVVGAGKLEVELDEKTGKRAELLGNGIVTVLPAQ